MASITLRGKRIQTLGDVPQVAHTAPAFTLTQNNLKDISLQELLAKTDTGSVLLSIVPSIDTEICATHTTTFEGIAADWPQVKFLLASMDLPFAQQRFCAAQSIRKVKCLSAMRNPNFAKDYGVYIQDGIMAGLMARAVIIIHQGKISYSELVEDISQAPNYAAILVALNTIKQ
ncbi:MAG: thiol peroxidase [Thiohalomonadales bacterium]